MPKSYRSIAGFAKKIQTLKKEKSGGLFFRGHSSNNYKLSPSVFRNFGLQNHEADLLNGIISESPAEFERDRYALEKIVRAQHYGIPSRLLDLTTNPLIALYFACSGQPENRGQVVVLEVSSEHQKWFSSDSVSCKANLAFLSDEERQEIVQLITDDAKEVFGKLKKGWGGFKESNPKSGKNMSNSSIKKLSCRDLYNSLKKKNHILRIGLIRSTWPDPPSCSRRRAMLELLLKPAASS